MAKLPSALLALACSFLHSCAWFGSQAEVLVSLPQPPEHWVRAFPDLAFHVVYQDTEGWHSVTIQDVSQSVLIHCGKLGNTPILAFPVSTVRTGSLRPAGGLYPMDCVDRFEPPHLVLSWHGGCRALIFKMLAERGFDTSLINSARLASYLNEQEDPWALDLESIAERLMRGDFSAFDFDLLPTRSVTLQPGPGEWFLETPCASPWKIVDESPITLPCLSIGMHTLFSVDGRKLDIWVGEKETVVGPCVTFLE